jgi:hypothetical protein
MPALHAKTPPIVVANTRHGPSHDCVCALMDSILTRLSGTVDFLTL